MEEKTKMLIKSVAEMWEMADSEILSLMPELKDKELVRIEAVRTIVEQSNKFILSQMINNSRKDNQYSGGGTPSKGGYTGGCGGGGFVSNKPTKKQIEFLGQEGIDASNFTKDEATKEIGRIIEERKKSDNKGKSGWYP